MPTGEGKEMLLISIGIEIERDYGDKRKWGKLKQVVAKWSNRKVVHPGVKEFHDNLEVRSALANLFLEIPTIGISASCD